MKTSVNHGRCGVSLVELLVATVVLLGISAVLISVTGNAGQIFRRTSGKIEQFGEARRGFENATRRLAEATLNTYWDYAYKTSGSSRVPIGYIRQSELRFRSGPMAKIAPSDEVYRPTHGVFFQAPAGWVEDREALGSLDQSLNSWGFFLEVGDDRNLRPPFLKERVPHRVRSRLMEFREPSENLSVYAPPNSSATNWWFTDALNRDNGKPVRVLAENIVALVILPRLSQADEAARSQNKPLLCPTYDYDSRRTSNYFPPLNPPDPEVNPKNQLPPIVQLVMVAIDEVSAARLAETYGSVPDLGIKTDDIFQDSTLLEDNRKSTEPADGDLSTLEQRLIEQKLAYRIFSTNVAIRGAKWSKAQTN